MKRTMILLLALWGLALQAQVRDRRADLDLQCASKATLSNTGRLWLTSRCGEAYTTDSLGAGWRTLSDKAKFSTGEYIIPFGDRTAVWVGYSHDDFVLRTETCGQQWDTVPVSPNLDWVNAWCSHADGRLWIASHSGRDYACMAYSADSGRTFTVLHPPFESDVRDGAVCSIHMVSADSGFAGTYKGTLYTTSDNWRTAHAVVSPTEQGLFEVKNDEDTWINKLRPWKQWLVVEQGGSVAYSTAVGNPRWQRLPLTDFEVDTTRGILWVIGDGGRLMFTHDMGHWFPALEAPVRGEIIGTLGGGVYLHTATGIVRVRPYGQADTCGFFSAERTISEDLAEEDKKMLDYGAHVAHTLFHGDLRVAHTLSHGGRQWRHSLQSIYMLDALGWYRVARPAGDVVSIRPDRDRSDRVIAFLSDGSNLAVDTAGRMEPYVYRQPWADFVRDGLQSVEIATMSGGCYQFVSQSIGYTREGDMLRRTSYTGKDKRHTVRTFPVEPVEQALLRLGECYSRYPSAADFGLRDGDVRFGHVFADEVSGWCTAYSEYIVTLVSRKGDTLVAHGLSDADCGYYFPWLLPMNISGPDLDLVTRQPTLWQALRPLMPEGMMLRENLDNRTLVWLQPGDLLFFSGEGGMSDAVRESTGRYSHVALVESVGDTVWIIDATRRYGVSRRPLMRFEEDGNPLPGFDIYRLTTAFDTAAVLARARSFVGQPYDNAFLPDNGMMYCSELVQACFLGPDGQPLFQSRPMNWRNAKGKLPRYWKRHFKKLKMPVPEGLPGTNPTDLSREPLLRKL